jgi:deoxyribonuclease V
MSLTHAWDLTPKEAIAVQKSLGERVVRSDDFGPVRRVAGIDTGFEDGGHTIRAAIAILSFPELELLTEWVNRRPTTFPYVPGLLSFRELPVVVEALAQLAEMPDLILYDGHGYAHPRRLGIASHLGVLLDLPTIGVAKKRLIGKHAVLADTRGAWEALIDHEETIGAVLRTRVSVKPVYVSTGHRVSLGSAIRFVLDCTTRFRLPETTRHAHRLASYKPPG